MNSRFSKTLLKDFSLPKGFCKGAVLYGTAHWKKGNHGGVAPTKEPPKSACDINVGELD
jgi:hypothetical protein